MSSSSWSFLIAAAGSGSRLGGTPKQFRQLGGRPLWRWSYDTASRLRESGRIEDIVIVLPDGQLAEMLPVCAKLGMTAVRGGATRSGSVLNGLKACRGSYVLVHDGARPFISEALSVRLMEAAEESGAALPLLPCSDALKKTVGISLHSEDRNNYFRTQTPQAFRREELITIMREGAASDDEASLWITSGREIAQVRGEEANFKITTQFDWDMACALAGGYTETRTGHGYDIHKLVSGRPLVIAGVKVDGSDVGLLGHSDADLVTHAVMDALLGAAGEPDIGTLFPANDLQWKDADSTVLLHKVLSILAAKGWKPDWVDATLNAQYPRLGHMIPRFKERLNSELGGSSETPVFNMKVKSAEECGSAGRGECMICHCVAVISRKRAL